jgi:outer membrane lipoprotein-sorting protein
MRKALLTFLAGSLLLAWTGAALSGVEDGRALVQKAIAAAGGEAKLAPFQSATWSEKGTYYGMGEGLPYTGTYAIKRPNQFRMEIEGAFTIILNGNKGWVQAGGSTMELKQDQLDSQHTNQKAGWIATLLPLKDKAFAIKKAGTDKVGDREALVVEVSRKDYPTVKLYFDKQNQLLIRSEYRVKAADLEFKEVVMDTIYSDFRDLQGARIPHKASVKRDGQRFVEAEFNDLKAVAAHDAKVFEKPAD